MSLIVALPFLRNSATSLSLKHQVWLPCSIADFTQIWYKNFLPYRTSAHFPNLIHPIFVLFTTGIKCIFKIAKFFNSFYIIIQSFHWHFTSCHLISYENKTFCQCWCTLFPFNASSMDPLFAFQASRRICYDLFLHQPLGLMLLIGSSPL